MTTTALPRPLTIGKSRAPGWGQHAALVVILAVQAALTMRLVAVNHGSGDEGRYIYAGHQLIRELWHGGGSPYYETYFSGAPVIYPVLAAMADYLGGLPQVAMMSVVFMLTATGLLYVSTRRLFGYWPGVLAAALFAGLGLTQDLGALATYDAMALMLMAAAVYCALRTADSEPHPKRWLLAVPFALLAANATKYMTLLFDPVIICLAALQVAQSGWRRIWQRVAALSAATAGLLALALFVAGGAYMHGVLFSTLARNGTAVVFASARESDKVVLAASFAWIGLPVLGAVVAVGVALFSRRSRRLAVITGLLLVAGTLVTIEGLHLHTLESMRKHDDFAAWFACAATGSILNVRAGTARTWLVGSLVALVGVVAGYHYSQQARATFEAGTSVGLVRVAAALQPYLELPGGRFLLGGLTDDEILYTDHLAIPWYQHTDDIYLKYPVPGGGGDPHGQTQGPVCDRLRRGCMYLEGPAAYRAAIESHYFALISMVGSHHGTQQVQAIVQAVQRTPGYVLLTRDGGLPTWIYAPAYRHWLAQRG